MKQIHLKIDNLDTDLCDGLNLIALIQVLSQKKIDGVRRKELNLRIYQLHNVSVALDFLKSEEVHLVNIGKYAFFAFRASQSQSQNGDFIPNTLLHFY